MHRPTCLAASTLSLWVLCGQRGAWAPCIYKVYLVYRELCPWCNIPAPSSCRSFMAFNHDITFCSKTLVSQRSHISELLSLGYKKTILLKRDAILRAHGMALYVTNGFSATHKACYECGCHEIQVVTVCGKHDNFYFPYTTIWSWMIVYLIAF